MENPASEPNESKPEIDFHAEGQPESEKHKEESKKTDHKEPPHKRFVAWYKQRRKWTIPASVLLFILLLLVLPLSRYKVMGIAVKQNVSVKVTDDTAHVPVGGALVKLGNVSATTDASGIARLNHVKLGHQKITITKKYYQDRSADILVPILKQKTIPAIGFTATGRQVKVVARNLISQKTLADIDIDINGQQETTDKNGTVLVVVPANVTSQQAKLSGKGYNDTEVNLSVSGDTIKENDVNLTPAGHVYFLSKLSGKIDVVRTNLDGTDRKTVLAGTGKEEDTGTVLLASRDWKYLALLSRRDSSQPKLYLINTDDDSMINMDGGSATFNVVGWSEDNFIYSVTRSDIAPWQPHGQALKSYNAQTGQLLTLDQTNATGTSAFDYAQESYGGIYIVGRTIIYDKEWSAYYYNQASSLSDKKAAIYTISASGNNAATLKTFDYGASGNTYLSSIPYEGDQIYYKLTQSADSYFAYQNGKISAKDNLSDDFDKYYQNPQLTYLLSPAADETLWAEPRDGKYVLFTGDTHGENSKQVAGLSDYQAYGWYTDDYLLISKNSSELYVIPQVGPVDISKAIKITDYHKPAVNFYGYGGGYGGL